jgi:hypothetical protein
MVLNFKRRRILDFAILVVDAEAEDEVPNVVTVLTP